jgi:peptide deformylase
MAVRDIVLFSKNETALRRRSEPVRLVNQRVKKIIKDLKDTLLSHPEGIGLAAPQINFHSRVIVVRLGSHGGDEAEPGPPLVLINPEVLESGREERDFDGCLSFPGLYAQTVRPHFLTVTALDEWGKPFTRDFEGFDAVLVHHELDHLDGILFIDRVTSMADLYRMRENDKGELERVPVVSMEKL